MRRAGLCIAVLAAAVCSTATGQDKTKKDSKQQVVDSGSFGIFLNGKRVGTETFRIEQGTNASVATAQLKIEDGAMKADQSSEMRVAPNGNLLLYTWRSTIPLKEGSVVEPNDQLLIEHITYADQKKQDVPYVMPLTTVILDDNFFSQREILVWRYLAACVPQDNTLHCSAAQFGTLIPHQHASGTAAVELLGREKIMVKGVEKELNKIKLTADDMQWVLWVADGDQQYKVIKMTVPAKQVEIVRD